MASRSLRRKLTAFVLTTALFTIFVPQDALAHGPGGDFFLGTNAVYNVAWNPQGTLIAVATAAGDISLLDGVGHVKLKAWHAVDGPINEVVFSPDGSKIAAASGAYKNASVERNVKVFDVATTTTLLTLTGHRDWVTSVVWSPDGKLIASASGVDDHEDISQAYGEVFFWDASTGALLWNVSPLPSYPTRMAWSPNGQEVATIGHLSDIWLLRYDRTRPTMEMINGSFHDPPPLHASHGWAIAWSPDSRYIAAGFSRDLDPKDGSTDVGPVIILDTTFIGVDGLAAHVRAAAIHTKPTQWVGWDSTGTYIASCSGVDLFDASGRPGLDGAVDAGELVIYNFSNLSQGGLLPGVNVYIGGTSWCSSLAWRPGNLTVAAGNADGSARVYILDEDGDGCFIWQDAAPLDPTTCTGPPNSASSFLDTWGLPLFAVGAGGVALILVLAARRSGYAAYAGNGGKKGNRGGRKKGKDGKGRPATGKGGSNRPSRPRDRRL